MKKLILLSLISTAFIAPAQAQENAITFDTSNINTKTSEVKLYNFSPELINAAQNCTPYQEDFIKNNPELGQAIPMLGNAKISVHINILGYNNQGKCQFSVQQKIPGLINTTYNCAIFPSRQKDIVLAMQDRSTTPITATFTTYSTVDYGDGRVEKRPMKQTMTDGKFNIIWSQIIAEDCQSQDELPSEQEQAELVNNAQALSEGFQASLSKCQPASEEKQFFFITEKAEIIGIENKGCHIKYADFDLYIPIEKLSTIKTFEDIKTLAGDKAISQYTPKYSTRGLKKELMRCLDASSYQKGGSETTSMSGISITNYINAEKSNNECILTFHNKLVRNDQETEYKKVCNIPLNKIPELLNFEEKNMLSIMEKQGLCQ